MNERGQEEAGFRLLVEAVLVAFILIIIITVIGQIEQFKWEISERRLFEGFDKALNSPDGSVIIEKDVVLKEGANYSSRAFAGSVTGIGPECIELEASGSSAYTLSNNKVVEITTIVQTTIYYRCQDGEGIGRSECPIFCTISFAKELQSP